MDKKSVKEIEVRGKRVLVRIDFNVPLDKSTGAITDDSRIRASLPTIEHLIGQGARTILCSHLGRPKGKVSEGVRLAPVGKRLAELLKRPVRCTSDCVGSEVEKAVEEMKESDVLLLENVRFHPEDERNDPEFASSLASLADIYVNDAFGAAHRAHASTVGVARYLPAVAGMLMEKELGGLGKALAVPAHPFAMVIGGAKVKDKISLLENSLEKVDSLIIGGGMANTFFKAQGYKVGNSKVEYGQLDFAQSLMEKASQKGVHFLLPVDAVVAREFNAESEHMTVSLADMPDNWMILDIGPRSAEIFKDELKVSQTIVWNGPMGVFEFPAFSQGTRTLASFIAGLDATTIIGGGDTAEAVEELGLTNRMTHVSTGGGASLGFLEGKTLPGVEALLNRGRES